MAARVLRAVGTLLVSAFCIAAVLLIAVALFARTDDQGVTRVAGRPVMTVLSDSMTPTFRAGDLLVERSAEDPATLSVGDIITFRVDSAGDLVSHRIVAIKHTGTGPAYRTKGDANNAADSGTVQPADVVGTYSLRIPFGGYALQLAHSKQGMFLLFLLPGLVFLVPEAAKWWRSSEDEAEAEVGATEVAQPVLAGSFGAGDEEGDAG